MADNDAGNTWFRSALAAKRRGRLVEEPDPDAEPEKPKPVDLGQGARGPIPSPPPSMNDHLRAHIRTLRREPLAEDYDKRLWGQ